MLVQCNRVQAQTHNLLTLQGVCKHIQLWSRVKEEQSITLTRDSRALHLEVTQSVARVVRKRESSKPRTDATRNETLLSAIPVTGDISSKKYYWLALLTTRNRRLAVLTGEKKG